MNQSSSAHSENESSSFSDILERKFIPIDPIIPVDMRSVDLFADLPEAPPFITETDEKEFSRIRVLLFKHFDGNTEPLIAKNPPKQQCSGSGSSIAPAKDNPKTSEKESEPFMEESKRIRKFEIAVMVLAVTLFIIFCFSLYKMIQVHYLREKGYALQAKLKLTETSLSDVQKALSEAKKQLTEADQTVSGLTSAKKALETELNRSNEANTLLTNENSGLKAERETLQADNKTLNEKQKANELQIAQLSGQVTEIGKERDELQKTKASLLENIAGFTITAEQIKAQIDTLTDQLRKTRVSEAPVSQ